MTAEQAYALVQNVLLGNIKTESRTTKAVIGAVPSTNLDYRPDPYAKSANEVMRHIAAADNFFLKSVIDGVFVPGSVTIPENVKTPQEVAHWYEQTYAANFETVGRLSGEHLIKMVDFRG